MPTPPLLLRSLLCAATLGLATVTAASPASRPTSQLQPSAEAAHPFAAGEQLQYRASWGIFGKAGTGTLVLAPDTVHGRQALHATFTIRGGIPGARIDERLESWMDRETLDSHRFVQRTRYPSFSRDRVREFFPDERRWTGHTNGRTEQGTLQSARALDELAFLYVARTLDLEVGQELVLDGYWKADAAP